MEAERVIFLVIVGAGVIFIPTLVGRVIGGAAGRMKNSRVQDAQQQQDELFDKMARSTAATMLEDGHLSPEQAAKMVSDLAEYNALLARLTAPKRTATLAALEPLKGDMEMKLAYLRRVVAEQ